MPRTAVRFCLITALLALPSGLAVGRERVSGVVRGAEALYVREGPGTEYAPFDSLPKGTEVEVRSVQGSWVKVRTPSGRIGYVHAAFLQLGGAAALPQGGLADANPSDTPSAPTIPAAANAAEVRAQVEPTPTIVEAEAAAVIVPADAEGKEDLRADVKRILRLTEELHGRMGEQRAMESAPPPLDGASRALGVASTLALSGIGLLCGFVVGSFYGRRQERNRRTRVRF